jgi:hypothetical protein
LLVVSNGDDSVKGWKFLFENVGVFEVHELHEEFWFILSIVVEGSWKKNAFFGGKKWLLRIEGS